MNATPPRTLLDRLGRPLGELRLSVTDRCNFRCVYCMPEDTYGEGHRFLPRPDVLSFEEIARVARVAVRRFGVRKLRLTGGEPLTRRQLPTLVAMLADIEGLSDLALTTNGTLLAAQARALAAAGLTRVTVSLDALDDRTFRTLSGGRGDVDAVLEGIEAARAAGLAPLKVNCVVRRGDNEHAIAELAEHFRGTGVVVRFIEFMDVGTRNEWRHEAVVPASEIRRELEKVGALSPLPRASASEVAERFAYTDGPGEVGIIASVTRPFCAGCSRARLSADGTLLSCLFAAGGLDLRGPMRAGADDDALAELWQAAWRRRDDRYSELRARRASTDARRRLEMYQVGG